MTKRNVRIQNYQLSCLLKGPKKIKVLLGKFFVNTVSKIHLAVSGGCIRMY